MNLFPLVAANFGAGGAFDFTQLKTSGQGFATNGVAFIILVFAVLAIAGLVVVLASRGGKTEILSQVAGVVVVGAVILVIIAFVTTQSNADLIGYVTTHADLARSAIG